MIFKLPYKLELMITKGFITLGYAPYGKDRKDRLLLYKKLWGMNLPFEKDLGDKLRS